MKWDSNNKLIPVTDSMIDAAELSSAKNSYVPCVQKTYKSKDACVVLNSTSNQPPPAKSGDAEHKTQNAQTACKANTSAEKSKTE